MRYGSVCSGVEAASLAWRHLGWEPAFLAEVEPFPCAVLAERWGATPPKRPLSPDEATTPKERAQRAAWAKMLRHVPSGGTLPNLGDFTKIQRDDYEGTIDLLVGGTPCQAFSIAGLRRGLADPRGNLMLEFTRLAYRTRPKWLVWENVPGVLTSGGGGRDFAAFLSLLVGWEVKPPAGGWRKSGIATNAPGCYGVAWRMLDAQYTRVPEFPRAVPQRRRRVLLVGYLGSWERAAAVLFDGEMCGGDTPPRREPRQDAAGDSPSGAPAPRTGLERAFREGSFAAYQPADDAAGPCRASGGTVSAGSENLLVRPCWWDGKNVAPTLTTRSLGQRMPDEGQLPCVVEPHLPCGDVCPTLDASYPGKRTLQDCDKLIVEPYGASLDAIDGCPVSRGVSQTLKVSAGGYNTAVAIPIDTMNTTGRPSANTVKDGIGKDGDPNPPLTTFHRPAVCTTETFQDCAGTVTTRYGSNFNGNASAANGDLFAKESGIVRRLLPIECERLMGFPDDYTKIPWKGKPAEDCPDAARYKACGNSMCVNVMAWIGERIQQLEESQK